MGWEDLDEVGDRLKHSLVIEGQHFLYQVCVDQIVEATSQAIFFFLADVIEKPRLFLVPVKLLGTEDVKRCELVVCLHEGGEAR